MAVLDYTNLVSMHALAKELTGDLEPSDLDSLLTESAGKHNSGTVTIYRPYLVAALILQRALNTRRLREARGAVFDRPIVTINGLMRQQASLDAKAADTFDDYVVPEGFEATSATLGAVTF